jgi:zinc/manganese transport system substrate-binding protein
MGKLRRIAASGVALLVLGTLAACGDDAGAGDDRPTVAVTTTVLGAVVRDLVGDAAEVRVILPEGVDPHEFRPSARDVEALGDADLVVVNGLGLEEGLTGAVDRARDDGVPVIAATDEAGSRPRPACAWTHAAVPSTSASPPSTPACAPRSAGSRRTGGAS